MRVLLVGADPSSSDWISRSLSTKGFVIDVVQTPQIAPPDGSHFSAIIVDLESKYSREAALIRKLRESYGSIPILALTGACTEARVRSLRAGADDCLAKPVAVSELMERLKRLVRQPLTPPQHVICVKGLSLNSWTHEIEVNGKHHVLRKQEAVLLEMFLAKPNRVVSKQRLSIDLYGALTEKTANAVEVGVHRLRKVLTDAGAAVSIETARGAGYVLKELAPSGL